MHIRVQVDDADVVGTLQRLIALGKNPIEPLRDIAALGESSTRLRFRLQRGPDGQRWKPSLRAQITGGSTLTKDGHLSGSISSRSGKDFAEWGVNRIYAAIHQFGGVIKAKSAGALKFKLPGGGFAVVKAVRMPARPYLGVNEDDRQDMLDILQRHIGNVSGGATHAG
jgi:phage virion morphogenesis protein